MSELQMTSDMFRLSESESGPFLIYATRIPLRYL